MRYDARQSVVEIEYNQHNLVIETQMIRDVEFEIGSLFQFIGETYLNRGTVRLSARVARNVQGLDLGLFNQALRAQRQFLTVTMAA